MKAGKSSGPTQTTSSMPDSEMLEWRRQIMSAAQRAAGVSGGGTASGSVPQVGGSGFVQGEWDRYGRPGVPGGAQMPNLPASMPAYIRDRIMADFQRRQSAASGPGAGSGPSAGSVSGLDPQSQNVIEFFTGTLGASNRAIQALSGDREALGQFLNPWTAQVADSVSASYEDARKRARNEVADYATKSGAWGGNRAALMAGTELAELTKAEQQHKASLYQGGFDMALQRASQTLNFGFGAAAQLPALGERAQWMTDPNLRSLRILSQAVQGLPYGTSQSVTSQSNWLRELLGLGVMGAGLWMGGAPGAAVGMMARDAGRGTPA